MTFALFVDLVAAVLAVALEVTVETMVLLQGLNRSINCARRRVILCFIIESDLIRISLVRRR
jgi:hypothetical protein